jgi:hypothetical protein
MGLYQAYCVTCCRLHWFGDDPVGAPVTLARCREQSYLRSEVSELASRWAATHDTPEATSRGSAEYRVFCPTTWMEVLSEISAGRERSELVSILAHCGYVGLAKRLAESGDSHGTIGTHQVCAVSAISPTAD